MKMKTYLILLSFFLIQSAFGQFDEYENKRMPKYFEEGNNLVSISAGKVQDNLGYEFGLRTDFFIKDGLSWGTDIKAIINHPQFYYLGFGQNIRGYLFHQRIRPLLEVHHSIKFGQDISFNFGIGGGVALAGITEMLGIDFILIYETPYTSFSDTKIKPYLIPSIGINFQW
jgi:hypothetical protein